MRFLLIVTALVVVSSTAFAADKPDTVTQYPSRIDTLRFDRINGVWKAITDTVWAQKIQVWLTPDQYKKLLELLAPPKPIGWSDYLWINCVDSVIPRTLIQLDTITDTPKSTEIRDSLSVWIGDCSR